MKPPAPAKPKQPKQKATGNDWRVAVAKALGGKATTSVRKFLTSWWHVEGGDLTNSAHFNWLNTTHGQGFPAINSVGVKSYPNFQTGVQMTAAVLRSGYPSLTAAIRSGKVDLNNPAVQGDLNRWLTGHRTPGMTDYVSKIAGGGKGGGETSFATPVDTSTALPTYAGPDKIFGDFAPIKGGFRAKPVDITGMPLIVAHAIAGGGIGDAGTGPAPYSGHGAVQLPMSFKATHDTDGIPGYQPSLDIMAHAGEPVLAPEAGHVVYFHPDGAQGGGSMVFLGVSGRRYWLGHLDNGLTHGYVPRGGKLAVVSYRKSPSHVHIGILSG